MNLLARASATINRVLPRQSAIRNVGVLVSGTALGQAIGVLALPVITRLYTPADFSVLAVYMSILVIVPAVACLQLDTAIPLPERDDDASKLLAVALLCCTVLTALVALAVWCLPEQIVRVVKQPGLRPFLWMLPLGIWLASAYSVVLFWATRKKRFVAIARNRASQTVGSVIVQIGVGLWGALGAFGLLLGPQIISCVGLFSLGRAAWRDNWQALRQMRWSDTRRVLRAHDRFPKYSTIETLADSGAVNFPIIIIAAVALGPEAGYLLLATRVLGAPLSLVVGAISQVYLSRAPSELRAGQLAPFTLKTIAGLGRVGIGPLLFVGITAPTVFPWIFGASWHRVGLMVTWMTPWYILNLLSSPLSQTLRVTSKQHIALAIQLFGLALRVGATGLAALLAPTYVFESYAVSGFVFYAAYLLVGTHTAGISGWDVWCAVMTKPQITLAWIASGIIMASAFVFVWHMG